MNSMKLIGAAILFAALCPPAQALNMITVTVRTDLQCLAQFQACGEVFSTSRIIMLDTQHEGKTHMVTTRGWVCQGQPPLTAENTESEPARVNSVLFGYVQLTPIFSTAFQGVKGRATGGIPGVLIGLDIQAFCDATAC